MYFWIDENENYKLYAETTNLLHIPEICSIVNDSKYGWNFVYYLYLFCARQPFGYMQEEDRDRKIAEIIEDFPYDHDNNVKRKTHGFFTHAKFKKAAPILKELMSDPDYDIWLEYQNDIKKILKKKSVLDLDEEKSLVKLGIYTDLLSNLSKLSAEAKKKMDENFKNNKISKNMGLGEIIKKI